MLTPRHNVAIQLDEIRKHLFNWGKSFIAFTLCFYPFNQKLYQILATPLMLDKPHVIIATQVISPFTTPLKLCLFSAFCLSMPILLWQLWLFLQPALKDKEKIFLANIMTFGTLFFAIGIGFCWLYVLPNTLAVFQKLTPSNVVYMPDMQAYLDFALTLLIAFGLCFEFPVLLIAMTKLNIVSIKTLQNKRREVIVASFVIAMLLTPPDVTSQIMLAIPMWLLFELSLILCKMLD